MSLLQKIDNSLKKHAKHTAIEDGELFYSYEDLRSHILFISQILKQKKLKKVAIIGEPSFITTSSLLSALMSELCYVPIDISWPVQRINQILNHSSAEAILSSVNILKKHSLDISSLSKDCFLDIQTSGQLSIIEYIKGEKQSSYFPKQIPNDFHFSGKNTLAYIMYTSGSSGEPKGVEVPIKSLEKFLDWVKCEFQISPQDRFSYTSSLGFGASIRQIFSPILSGASMVCMPQNILKNPNRFLSALQHKKITLFNAPPVLLQKLAETAKKEEMDKNILSSVRLVLAGGDLFPKKILKLWLDQFQHKHQIVNLYGSTESIVNASSYFAVDKNLLDQEYLPIGQARPDLQFFLLDEKGEKIKEDDKVGELCIQSDFLAKAYHKNKKETDKTFVSSSAFLDPLSSKQSSLYKTGDRAIKLSTGDYLVLGRLDTQVQIYGQRVELGEVESHLNQHPQIKRAFVIYLEENEFNKIWAFVQFEKTNVSEKELRRFLKQKIPSYMIPHSFFTLDDLLLSSSGKVDYKALKKRAKQILESQNFSQEKASIKSLSQKELEESIKKIWKKYVGEKEFSNQDNFFDIGGDSILAVSLYQDLCEHFNISLDPYTFYYSLTVKKTAQNLKSALHKQSTPQPVALQKNKRSKFQLVNLILKSFNFYNSVISFFNFIILKKEYLKKGPQSPQQKHFLLMKMALNELYNGCFSAPIESSFDEDTFKQALNLTVKHQESLRTVFIGKEQVVLPEYPIDLLVYDLQSEPESEQKKSIRKIENQLILSEFNLSQLPLCKIALLKLSPDKSYLIFCINHVIGDGWSLQSFLSFLNSAYSYLKGELKSLDSYSYLQYTKKYKLFCRKRFHVNQSYWEETFSKISHYNLSDKLKQGRENEAHEKLILDQDALKKIDDFCKKHKLQKFYLILSLWSQSLKQFLSCEKIWYFTTHHSRDFPLKNMTQMIGSVARVAPLFIDFKQFKNNDISAIQKIYLEVSKHKDFNILKNFTGNQNEYKNNIIFNYLDFQSLSYLTPKLPFSIDWNQAKVQMSSTKENYNRIYLLFSIHNYSNRLEIQAYGRALSQHKKELIQIVKTNFLNI